MISMIPIDIEKLGICISMIISVISLIISVKSYKLKIPKLEIKILNRKCDCFFGIVETSGMDEHKSSNLYTAGANFRITNNSPAEITVSDIKLKVRNELYRLVDNRSHYWEEVVFLYKDESGTLTSDGTAIYYGNDGISVPFNIKPYGAIDAVALFHYYPTILRKKLMAKLILYASIGDIKKRIVLIEWDDNFHNAEYQDFLKHERSLKVMR